MTNRVYPVPVDKDITVDPHLQRPLNKIQKFFVKHPEVSRLNFTNNKDSLRLEIQYAYAQVHLYVPISMLIFSLYSSNRLISQFGCSKDDTKQYWAVIPSDNSNINYRVRLNDIILDIAAQFPTYTNKNPFSWLFRSRVSRPRTPIYPNIINSTTRTNRPRNNKNNKTNRV